MFQIRERLNRKHFSMKTLAATYLEYFFSTALFLRPIQPFHMTQAYWKYGAWQLSQCQYSEESCIVLVFDYRNFQIDSKVERIA